MVFGTWDELHRYAGELNTYRGFSNVTVDCSSYKENLSSFA